MYHIRTVLPDNLELFELIIKLSDRKTIEYLNDKHDSHGYRLISPIKGSDYLVASLSRFRNKEKVEESLPFGSEGIEENIIENPLEGKVMFYLDTENFIILEENHNIPRDDFEIVFKKFVKRGIIDGLARNGIAFSGKELQITYFQLKDKGLEDFFSNVPKITRIQFRIKTLENPFLNTKADLLKEIIDPIGAETLQIESNGGLNRESEFVQGMMSLDESGHISSELIGKDSQNREVKYVTGGKNDDLDRLVIENGISDFINKAKGLIIEIKKVTRKSK